MANVPARSMQVFLAVPSADVLGVRELSEFTNAHGQVQDWYKTSGISKDWLGVVHYGTRLLKGFFVVNRYLEGLESKSRILTVVVANVESNDIAKIQQLACWLRDKRDGMVVVAQVNHAIPIWNAPRDHDLFGRLLFTDAFSIGETLKTHPLILSWISGTSTNGDTTTVATRGTPPYTRSA